MTTMKTKILFVFALFITIFFSCKEEKKTEEVLTEETKEVLYENFTVTLGIVAKKDDNLHLYFTEDNSINFTEDKSVWAEIKGNEANQQVVFKLPINAIPTDLRLDLGYGKNPEQMEILINSINFNYFDKSLVIKGSEVSNYFYPNKQNTVLDNLTGTVKRIKVDQETAPSLYPHTALEEALVELTRE